MSEGSEPLPAAVVTCGAFRAELHPGESLHFGRAAGNELRIGSLPEDLRVPRNAGRLECREDGVLIHNLSDKRTLLVHTFPGPGYEISPLMLAGTHPHDHVRLSLTGHAAKYLVYIDTRGLRVGRTLPHTLGEATETVGFRRIQEMSDRHRFFLTALCLPLMTTSGVRAQVPSYAGIEQLLLARGLSYKAKTVRNNLDELRSWLTYEHQIDDLMATDEEPAGAARMVDKLALWAIRSGNVTDADVERLDAYRTGGAAPDVTPSP